ncbi:DNA polymerase III subunit gamma and tau [Actinoplanes sp. HUAS TT8]|uniref:DNA polymerase III subunit gamma and tau n=1 Tax=Actinoplanes sp. HUAS TT8 TaxID=3447453 RepID=UPI003F528ED4
MALALYRKYRPRTFAEVIGQEHVTEPLSQALRSGRLNHAYLFSGPRGCGKTSSARILARSLNCEQGPTPDPCGVCMSCKSLANDGAGSIDVIEIDAASHGGVDDARELREKAFFAPANSRYKIYVIDEAHMVSSAGFNALLKLVEEPPEYVKFIFATTEPDKVLGTIRSRTHHYPFRLIPPATLRPYLQQLTDAEGITVEPAVFPLVVKAGGGSARDTLSVLDQLIAGAGPDGVTYARAVSLLGVTDAALIDEMCDALADGNGAAAYETIDRVAEAGHDSRRYASDLLERLRDLIVLQQVPDAVAKGLIDGPADQLEAMHQQASRLGAATLSRCADIVHTGLVEMRGTTAPRLLLELITARMLLPGADDSTGALLQRLERLEKQGPISDVRGVSDAPAVTVPGDEDSVGAVAPVSGGSGGGLAAARAAAAAAARSRSGPARPVSPAPVAAAPESAVPAAPVSAPPVPAAPVSAPSDSVAGVAPASAPPAASVSEPPAADPEAVDWNRVADGGQHEDEPSWEEEPPADTEPVAQSRPPAGLPQVRAVWEAFGAKDSKIQAMQGSGIGLRDVEGEAVFFTAPNPRYAERFLTFADHIATEFTNELGGRWQIRCDVGDGTDTAARNAAPRSRPQPAEQPAGRDHAGARDQSAARRMPAARPPSTAPERNTGRTESRPSRPQRAPATDADDDWPAPLPPEPIDDDPYAPGPVDHSDAPAPYSGGPAPSAVESPAGRAPASAPPPGHMPASGPPAGHAPASGPSVSYGAASAQSGGHAASPRPDGHAGASERPADHGVVSGPAAQAASDDGDTDWPEPVRPGSAAVRAVSPPADDDWPEPVKPGTWPPASTAPVADSVSAAPVTSGVAPVAAPVASVSPTEAAEDSWAAPGTSPAPGVPEAAEGPPWPEDSAMSAAAPSRPAEPADSVGPPWPVDPAASSAPAGPPWPTDPAAPPAASAPAAPARSAAMEAARAAAARGGNASPSSGLAAARAAAANAAKGGSSRGAAPAAASQPAAAGGSAWADGTPIGEAPYDPEFDGPPPAAGGFEGFDPGDEPLDEVIDEKTARQSSEEQAFQLLRDAFGAEKIGEV